MKELYKVIKKKINPHNSLISQKIKEILADKSIIVIEDGERK